MGFLIVGDIRSGFSFYRIILRPFNLYLPSLMRRCQFPAKICRVLRRLQRIPATIPPVPWFFYECTPVQIRSFVGHNTWSSIWICPAWSSSSSSWSWTFCSSSLMIFFNATTWKQPNKKNVRPGQLPETNEAGQKRRSPSKILDILRTRSKQVSYFTNTGQVNKQDH